MSVDAVLSGAERWAVVQGDCREVLAQLADGSVDAVVTDPPYMLGFMGKDFDRPDDNPAADVVIWRAVLRVLKPGAHLLAFGGTRTSHRMVCAIEDAGFEVRDSIHWIYGSGFPKSLDVSKAIDKARDDTGDVRHVCRFLRSALERSKHTATTLGDHFGFHSRMIDHWAACDTDSQPALPTPEQWLELKRLLGFGDSMDAEVARLNERKGEFGEAWKNADIMGEHTGQTPGLPGARFSSRDSLVRAPATDAAKKWQGFGTALKPGHEIVCLARKPLAGTVAANVCEHGTGGINVDGCRVGTERDVPASHSKAASTIGATGISGKRLPSDLDTNIGRWPPNVCLTHSADCRRAGTREVKGTNPPGPGVSPGTRQWSEDGGWKPRPAHTFADAEGLETVPVYSCAPDCPVAELGRQSGAAGADNPVRGNEPSQTGQRGIYGLMGRVTGPFPADTGTAARFFPQFEWTEDDWPFRYVAKASRAEREAGCASLPEHTAGEATDRRDGTAGLNSPRAGAGRTGEGIRNPHPTVKPLDLMRWLCRLVTPPGGLILDPFCGSGTTLIAAGLEGFRGVGVELDPHYCEIARARIRHRLGGYYGTTARAAGELF